MKTVSFSIVLRRIHLYLALFLTPWVLMYTVSTVYMNHKPRPGKPPVWELSQETTYDGVFPDGATHQAMARQILTSLDLDGAHQASRRPDGTVVIQRLAAVQPLRLTFTPESRKLVIERQKPDGGAFLERMHRRRGFQHPYGLDDIWAFLVDLFIAAMVFWALSGLWLWWEMKVTRKLGLLALVGGIALFGFFLAVL
jgi:hypothetical protein